MPSAAALRTQIESALERRFPAALTPLARTIRETAPTGIPEVDRLLDGGLPVGAITELTGPESSGRTTLALSFLAGCTQEEKVCAWVDVNDAFDAESAAACGVSLRQLLWVRCRSGSETARGKPWTRLAQALRATELDQALRATDLLLQAGGFAALVLDLGNTASELGLKIPLATWFRFRQAADRTRCSLLVLGQAPFAQSSAALVLECAGLHAQTARETVLSGFTYAVQRGRQRFVPAITALRKPPASTWSACAAWERENAHTQPQVFGDGMKNQESQRQIVAIEDCA